ncbi:MAG: 3-keto-5-aminohexanoate cleavage protein [Methylobacterium frigidaeris]
MTAPRTQPTWIEAALNGPWGRERQPGIPVAVEEIVADGIAAAQAGAAIVHVHAYDPATGRQRDDWETYARIIEGIRARVDAIVYPTIPLAGSDYAAANAARRFAHTAALAERGLIEWAVLDPGSTTFARFDELAEPGSGFIYQNPMADIREGLRIAGTHRVHPGYAIYEPGFTRLGAALAALDPRIPTPIYRFMFSDEFAWGFPPRPRYLDAHLALLAEVAPHAPWMVAGLGVDIRPLIPEAVRRGGHVRVGLEDAPWGCGDGNRVLVEDAARQVAAAGGTVADAAAVRRALAGNGVARRTPDQNR